MKSIFISVAIALSVALAGCASSGPRHNTDVITLADGELAYRVQCQGLLEDGAVCQEHAKQICADRPITLISTLGHVDKTYQPEQRAREITIRCGASSAS
ncbi:hypothetical protein [Achromobacter sp. UMC46]|uniref:hypothetical protein n=1 Tax=Achromobacter sp. UMC46 TaxID=1862319 RepID=UPI0015FF58F8|nr:hypothetical protein [Achromobacter sp. UMC46]MBB1597215.1 hypothetical protein [Achromobacter sp. UMC46]